MARSKAAEIPVNGSLSNASVDCLTCLLRHWTWADEALARFEQELAGGWEYDDAPVADHPRHVIIVSWAGCQTITGSVGRYSCRRGRGDSRVRPDFFPAQADHLLSEREQKQKNRGIDGVRYKAQRARHARDEQ